jgi:uncharacterized sulfatase
MTKNQVVQAVLIVTDTQGSNIVGCYGRPEMMTPNIDRLADQGVLFERAYTASPVCSPARSAIFTGTSPHTNGCWANHLPLGTNIKTVGQRLTDRGITAACVGKWHLDGTDYFGNGRCPEGWLPAYWYDGRNYLEELTPEERRLSQTVLTPDQVHDYAINERFLYAHRVGQRAIEFLKTHSNESFLLAVCYYEPHSPFLCPPPYCDMFRDFEYEGGENVFDPLESKPENHREWAAAEKKKPSSRSIRSPMYFGCNSYIDHEIGRVLDAIDSHAPGALVVFTSDHGTPLHAHGLNSKGPAMYDEITRVPFVVRLPGARRTGVRCRTPISQISITPTILNYFAQEAPDFLEGPSILPLIRNPADRPETIFMEFNRFEVCHDGWGGFQPIRAALDGRFKLVVNLHYMDELYDLRSDPGEMRNLIASPEHEEDRARLHEAILDWMDSTRDPFRGMVWERRPWSNRRTRTWGGYTRLRPPDGYEPVPIRYETGLEAETYLFTPRAWDTGE